MGGREISNWMFIRARSYMCEPLNSHTCRTRKISRWRPFPPELFANGVRLIRLLARVVVTKSGVGGINASTSGFRDL